MICQGLNFSMTTLALGLASQAQAKTTLTQENIAVTSRGHFSNFETKLNTELP